MVLCKDCKWHNPLNKETHHGCTCPKMVYGYGPVGYDLDGVRIVYWSLVTGHWSRVWLYSREKRCLI